MKIITLLLILYTLCPLSGYAKIDERVYDVSNNLAEEFRAGVSDALRNNLTNLAAQHPTWYGIEEEDRPLEKITDLVWSYFGQRYDIDLYKATEFYAKKDSTILTNPDKEQFKNFVEQYLLKAINIWAQVDAIVLGDGIENLPEGKNKSNIKAVYDKRRQDAMDLRDFIWDFIINNIKITSTGQEVTIDSIGRFVHRISTPAFIKENTQCIIEFLKKNFKKYKEANMQANFSVSQDSTFIYSDYIMEYYRNTSKAVYRGYICLSLSIKCSDASVTLFNYYINVGGNTKKRDVEAAPLNVFSEKYLPKEVNLHEIAQEKVNEFVHSISKAIEKKFGK